ncbi:MAG: ABC transporter ATP-binding protein [Rhodoferax sp.]|jgi:branched-chain amino acid transport system ATP-binding protein|nr:ABC transporter ATP-binding protein [Rhodoferax sp.]MCF8210428.1 ABC transporter ATP-binding protein [Rhodoferax sp.]
MTQTVLEVADLTKSFGRASIIRGADLQVTAGERHALIGPNGAGKSTLFHLISGRIASDSGSIRFNGQEISAEPAHRIARLGLARSFQINNLFLNMSAFENIRLATLWSQGVRAHSLWRMASSLRNINDKADQVLESLHLMRVRNVLVGTLSYAEQRALEIGMAIAGDPRMVLLDEPTAGMSKAETERMLALIRSVTIGRSLLVIEHDMQMVFNLADRISVLVYGKVIATGTPQEVRSNPQVQEAYLGSALGDPK